MQLSVGSSIVNLKTGDITKENVDAIVNAANSSLMGGGGVDGAIHHAGGPKILEECKGIICKIGKLGVGEAVMTSAGNMPSKYVIHTVGPIWRGGNNNENQLLYNAYYKSLRLADEKNLNTISFPSISTGVYRFPLAEAANISFSALSDFLRANNGLSIINLVLFSEESYQTFQKAYQAAK